MSSHQFELHGTAEGRRIMAADSGQQDRRAWGPYLSERAWGTVREDYSEHSSAGTTSRMIMRGRAPTDGNRRDQLMPPLDRWLSRKFSPPTLPATGRELE